MPVLRRGTSSSVGAGEQAGEGHAGTEREGVPLSLLTVRAHVPALPAEEHARRRLEGVSYRAGRPVPGISLAIRFQILSDSTENP